MGGGRVVLSKNGSNGVTNPLLIITLIILFLIEGMMLPYFSAESKIKYIYARSTEVESDYYWRWAIT